MRLKVRLRVRLLIVLWAIFFLALLVPSLYYGKSLKNEILQETTARATRELSMIRDLMGGENFEGPEQLHAWLSRISGLLQVRITYVAEGGRVLADTDVPFDQTAGLENHATRPEIIKAHQQATGTSIRYSGTVKTDLLYVAQAVEGRGKIPGGYLRVAIPVSSIFYGLGKLAAVQNLIIITGFIAFALISFGLMVSMGRSVSILASAADSIGQGNVKILPRFHPGSYFYPVAKSIRENAERVESYIRTITRQKLQLESILEGIEEGILLLNSAGRIDSANRAARNMLSWVPELRGRRPLEVIRSPELQAACDRVLGNEIHSYHSEASIGADRFYHVHIVRIEQPKDEYGAVLALHDISELKRLEKVRRDFVANASHELRTPLTSIKGYTEVLMSDDDPEVRSSCLEVIYKNSNHMIKMVNDLLQLAKVEEYNTIADIKSIKANEALSEAWKSCLPSAASRNVSLQDGLPADGPEVKADFDQIVQVFRNLLENAVKYSPQGEKIEVFSKTDSSGRVIIGVSDSGPGIPKQDRQRIFERFFRIERFRGKEPGSTGLGLAICRHIIRSHGGTIWVESPREGMSLGSTFYFTLPAAESGDRAA